jgi:hypothetical protein
MGDNRAMTDRELRAIYRQPVLEVSIRAHNVLRRVFQTDYPTVGQVLSMPQERFRRERGAGKAVLTEVLACLVKHHGITAGPIFGTPDTELALLAEVRKLHKANATLKAKAAKARRRFRSR